MHHTLPYVLVAFSQSNWLILLLVVDLLLSFHVLSQLLQFELLLLDPELELLIVHVLLLVVLGALHKLLVDFSDLFNRIINDRIQLILLALLSLRVLVLLVDFLSF